MGSKIESVKIYFQYIELKDSKVGKLIEVEMKSLLLQPEWYENPWSYKKYNGTAMWEICTNIITNMDVSMYVFMHTWT